MFQFYGPPFRVLALKKGTNVLLKALKKRAFSPFQNWKSLKAQQLSLKKKPSIKEERPWLKSWVGLIKKVGKALKFSLSQKKNELNA